METLDLALATIASFSLAILCLALLLGRGE
jgi:hypothetical protein